MAPQFEILLMEGDGTESKKISALLQRYGFAVTIVNSGYAAMKVLFNSRPELVIGSVQLPGINGFDILKTMKNNIRLKHIPVIMTAKVLEEKSIHKSKQLGASAYIRIPSTCTLLYAIKRSLRIELLEAG